MVVLVPVQYGKRQYPPGITPGMLELPAHFDAPPVATTMPYSLHTEYSFKARTFCSPSLDNLETIKAAERSGIPQLWNSHAWAREFGTFISRLTGQCQPRVIEIHPPFVDYCPRIEEFIEVYRVFEEFVSKEYPGTRVLIENRYGSRNRDPFLISSAEDLVRLVEQIERHSLILRIAFDPIQMLTGCGPHKGLTNSVIRDQLQSLGECATHICGLHLWGKKRDKRGCLASHVGDLNTYFEDDELKRTFLDSLCALLDDDVARFFVPEVNSHDTDLASIVADLVPRCRFA